MAKEQFLGPMLIADLSTSVVVSSLRVYPSATRLRHQGRPTSCSLPSPVPFVFSRICSTDTAIHTHGPSHIHAVIRFASFPRFRPPLLLYHIWRCVAPQRPDIFHIPLRRHARRLAPFTLTSDNLPFPWISRRRYRTSPFRGRSPLQANGAHALRALQCFAYLAGTPGHPSHPTLTFSPRSYSHLPAVLLLAPLR